jgi:hypothetical protein
VAVAFSIRTCERGKLWAKEKLANQPKAKTRTEKILRCFFIFFSQLKIFNQIISFSFNKINSLTLI